jgi:hypothetical protein
MKLRFYLTILLGFLLVSFNLYAQEDSTVTEETWEDSTANEERWDDSDEADQAWEDVEDDWDSHAKEWDWEWDEDWMDWEFHGRPTIELNYGIPQIGIRSLTKSEYGNVGLAELKIGYSTLREYEDYISKYRFRYLFLNNFSKDFASKEDKYYSELFGNIWQFGIGWQEGYGYQIGKSAIIPYTSNSAVWTRLKANYYNHLADGPVAHNGKVGLAGEEAIKTMDLFNDAFRFGTSTEGGIKIQPVSLITLNAGFERTIVFPRHLFWKHLGSMCVEWIGLGMADFFTREIMDESPAAGPIMNFILKNAVSFGMYQLRREKMNWPFKSAEPLTIDTFKFGVTFTF